MKIQIYLISLISILILSCQNERFESNSVDSLKKMSKIKTQIFNLDTISLKTIKGESGTIIIFDRQKFDIPNNAKITLKLTEFNEFKDLVLNNIQTITKENKLLESSGVFKIEFFADGKPIKLKKGMYLEINIPKDKMNGNILFSGEIDTLGNMKWDEIKNEPIVVEENVIGVKRGVNALYKVIDTVSWTYPNQSTNDEEFESMNTANYQTDENGQYFLKNYDWINIDRYIEGCENRLIKMTISEASNRYLDVYILYHGQNSFSSDSFYNEKTIELPIQYLPKKTFAVVVSNKKGELYADKFELNNKYTYHINLKKTDLNKIFQMMELN